MARREDGFLDLLADLPWWVSICVGAGVFVGLRFIVPSLPADSGVSRILGSIAPQLSWVSLIFLFPAAVSAAESFRKRSIFDRQSGIESIRALSWIEFEGLLGEAFRRQGYSVRENTFQGPDGGIDLTIGRNGNLYLVQCKHWRTYKVGVSIVREMLGLVTAHGASGAIIVTTGLFTQEAKTFASNKAIDLVEGRQLVELVRSAQASPMGNAEATLRSARPMTSTLASETSVRHCPACGAELVLRVARRGSRPGSKFWGCSSYPRCRHTEELED